MIEWNERRTPTHLYQAAGASYLFAAWGEKNAHWVGLPMRSDNFHAGWVRREIYDGKHEATKSGTHQILSVVEMPLNYSGDGLIIFQMDSNSDSLSSMPVWYYGCVAAVQFIATNYSIAAHLIFFVEHRKLQVPTQASQASQNSASISGEVII